MRNRPLDLLQYSLQRLRVKPLLILLLPLCIFYPIFTISILCCLGCFLLGLLLSESLLPPEGTASHVEGHFQNRIAPKLAVSQDYKWAPSSMSVDKDVSEIEVMLEGSELIKQVDLFVDYVVRDFINDLFYKKINHSQSNDFQDSVRKGLKQVLLKLGLRLSKLNKTDILLALVKVLISHIKEYKNFDLTSLDMQDYLALNPHSKFVKLNDRGAVIASLRDISLKLCVFLLPRSERSSQSGFAIVQEILATTVLLPILEKASQPDLINCALFAALSLSKDSANPSSNPGSPATTFSSEKVPFQAELEKGYLNRRSRIEDALQSVSSRISFIAEKMADVNIDPFLVEEKISLQARRDELNDLLNEEMIQNTPLNKYLDLKSCSVLVRYVADESSSSISPSMSFLQNRKCGFEVELQSEERMWKVRKSEHDFVQLEEQLKQSFPLVKRLPPSVISLAATSSSFFEQQKSVDEMDDVASEVMIWLSMLIKHPAVTLFSPFFQFLQPSSVSAPIADEGLGLAITNSLGNLWKSSSTESLQNALHSSINSSLKITQETLLSPSKLLLAESKPSDGEQNDAIQKSFSSISQEDLDVLLDVLFSSFEELFSIDGEQWIAQQSLSLIKVILKRSYSSKLSSSIGNFMDSLSSQETAAKYTKTLNDKLWPSGRPWGSVSVVERSQDDMNRTKHQLWCLLNDQEGVKKKGEFEKTAQNISKIIGQTQTQKGFSRGFLLIQNQGLMLALMIEMLDVLTNMAV